MRSILESREQRVIERSRIILLDQPYNEAPIRLYRPWARGGAR